MDISPILNSITIIEIILLILIAVPTAYAMIEGAPFVPTSMMQVRRMLSAVPLKKGMVLYDLGAGDGRLVHLAAKEHGLTAIGYEYSPLVWLWSKFMQLFWRSKAERRFGNFWKQDFSDADVIVCYLMPGTMTRIHERLFKQLKPGTFIISNAFQIKGLEVYKELPRLRDKKLAPIRIYKVGAKTKPKRKHRAKSAPPKKTSTRTSQAHGPKAKPLAQ